MIVAFILLLIFILLIAPIGIDILIENKKVHIDLVIFNKIKFKIIHKKNIFKFERGNIKNIEENSALKKLVNRVKKDRDYLHKIEFKKMSKKIFKRIDTNIDFNLIFGFERKDITATLYGFLCAILAIIEVKINRSLKNSFNYSIIPDFNREYIDLRLKINLKTNLFRLIFIIFILFKETLIVRKNKKI